MKKSYLYASLVIVVVLVAFGLFFAFGGFNNLPSKIFKGTFYVSDAGSSHGGFEYTGGWNATLTIYGNKGALKLDFAIGLGDPLQEHEYDVTEFDMDNSKITMIINGRSVMLLFIKNDKIWEGQYDDHYIASWGGYAPIEEIIGEISPKIFPGLPDHYYVELRVR